MVYMVVLYSTTVQWYSYSSTLMYYTPLSRGSFSSATVPVATVFYTVLMLAVELFFVANRTPYPHSPVPPVPPSLLSLPLAPADGGKD